MIKTIAQLLGITFGLSISGAVFVNYAINGLLDTIPNVTHDEIESALLGVSGNILGQLPAEIQAASLAVIVEGIKKVYAKTSLPWTFNYTYQLLKSYLDIFQSMCLVQWVLLLQFFSM